MTKNVGVILLAYGSPENLDDIGEFLTHIRGGKELPSEKVAAFRTRYEQTGGPSPLNRITRQQAQSLAQEFEKSGERIRTFVGMAHCRPWIRDGVIEARSAGITHLIGLPMAPHFSTLSTGKYQRFLDQAIQEEFPQVKRSLIRNWYDESNILAFFQNQIAAHLNQHGKNIPVIFSVHSLPERVLAEKDPYPSQVRDNAEKISQLADLPSSQWQIAYQSRGLGTDPWLGPSVEEVVKKLGEQGRTKVLVCPIGFCADHIEILYDLDIDLKDKAKNWGVQIFRTASLNTDPGFIQGLALCLRNHLAEHA